MASGDEKWAWVERVLGLTVTDASDPFEQMYNDLLETVRIDVQLLSLTDPTAAESVEKLVDDAANFARKSDFETAFGFLNRATDTMARQVGAGRVRDASETIPQGLVADMVDRLERAEDRWNSALSDAQAGAEELYRELAATMPESADGLQNVLESYWNEMLAAITEAKAGGERADADAVLQTMEALRSEMQADDLLSYMDSNGIAARPAFFEAFDELGILLRG